MGEPPPLPEALLARLHENFAEAYRVIGRNVPGGAVWESEGATAVATGVGRAEFNRLFVLRPPADADVLLDHASQFFAAAGVPWCIIVPPDIAPLFANASAIEPGSHIVGMAMADLRALPPRPGTTLTVRAVETVEDAATFVATMAAGFNTPRELFDLFGHHSLLGRPGLTHYLGFVGPKPVATATLVASHGIAGIFNVSTLASHRRRGYGETMTWHALRDGLAEGCSAAGLQATPLGYPIYRRMGFRGSVDYRSWYPLESLIEEGIVPPSIVAT
ncbi:MAG: hypothetical protein U0547_04690 [Dehalococcoidia bacterium]